MLNTDVPEVNEDVYLIQHIKQRMSVLLSPILTVQEKGLWI